METNLSKHRSCRLKAANLGATAAQYAMGVAYRTGDGVPQDVGNSLTWLRKAAAKNHPKALYDLAVHHWPERTNPASKAMANDYMLRTAERGHREAQFQYAMICFRGETPSRDFESGRRWLAEAAESGWAHEIHSTCALNLDIEQIALIQARVALGVLLHDSQLAGLPPEVNFIVFNNHGMPEPFARALHAEFFHLQRDPDCLTCGHPPAATASEADRILATL